MTRNEINTMSVHDRDHDAGRPSLESTTSSASTTSLVFERISDRLEKQPPRHQNDRYMDGTTTSDFDDEDPLKDEESNDLETGPFLASVTGKNGGRHMDYKLKRIALVLGGAFVAIWIIALALYLSSQAYRHGSDYEHDPQATSSRSHGKKVTLEEIQEGYWSPTRHAISWIAGADGEDGLLLERDAEGKDYLVVEDVKSLNAGAKAHAAASKTLMKSGKFIYAGKEHVVANVKPSPDLKKVLVGTDVKSNWRHSSTAVYWIWDVETQNPEPLVTNTMDARIQLANWTPTSDGIVYTRENNMFIRPTGSRLSKQITTDGGADYFYGIPDWVYEEEVFGGASATWLSQDGKHIAFLRTNETSVPEYPIQYFVSRPSGTEPAKGEENYPEVRQIKYPKAGAPNPVVDLLFYDIAADKVFSVEVEGGFADDDRLITEVIWAGSKVLVRETNRISDVMRLVLVDTATKTGKTVRSVDVGKADGGWFEISEKTTFIPADDKNGRAADGYVEMVIHENRNHLAYFTPLDNANPIMLTEGEWDVVDAPAAVDLVGNLVYFVGTEESSIQRHVYKVTLNGTGFDPITDASEEGYYGVSFSSGAGYALMNYDGPNIPWQKVVSTPSNPSQYEHLLEDNKDIASSAKKHELPLKIYGTISVDGVDLNYIERRPPHFDPKKSYPIIFDQYSGPGSQSVSKRFAVDWPSYLSANLGYVVVTVDGRGTGFIGRNNRVLVRGKLGQWESHDQIAAAKHWSKLKYIDASRIAIWGWSYGGFMALKTLEQDAGQTFSYGMAVAPVTDWRYYDSIYTERYMKMPQDNAEGYDGTAISNATALGQNVRFLLMHGIADDNVHMQNSLTLLDKLDLAGVENYDVHVFPDSDHSIYFHNGHKIVYDKLSNWIINAFNGEWLKVDAAKPVDTRK